MSRKRLFIENIFAYGFINVLNKIVPFLLLPVITKMLPNTSDYGVYDMYTTVVSFGTSLAMLGLYDAMFREYFEKDDPSYKLDVTTTAQRLILISSMIISLTLVLFNEKISYLFFGEFSYGNIIIFSGIGIFLGANINPIQGPTRMQNQRNVFVVSGIVQSAVMYGLSIYLINNGFTYLGLVYSNIITALIMVVFFWIRNQKFFLEGNFNITISKELYKVGLPLLPTFLIYWVYNSIDKIMITNILSTSELGIYSIGAKMAQVSQLIYAGFAGGYAYFKYSTMNDVDQVQMNSKLFEYLGVASCCFFITLYPFIRLVFTLLFEGSYQQGYIVTSYLLLCPLLLMLFQVVGSQFIVIKKSYFTSLTLGLGAICNIVLNYFFIKAYGIEGSAVATLIGYIVSIISVSFIANNNKLLIINKRICIVFTLTISYLIINRLLFHNNLWINLLLSLIILIFIVLSYSYDINELCLKNKNKKKILGEGK